MEIKGLPINVLEYFEPFLAFRFIVFLIFTAVFFYEMFDFILWYHSLPRLARKYLKMKLVALKLGDLKSEIILIITLSIFWVFVLWLNVKLM